MEGVVIYGRRLPLRKALKASFPRLAVKLKEPFSFLVPAVKDILPLMPRALFFFRIILMMPPIPCASYFAPGLVITSMLLIWLAGMDCNTSAILLPKADDGFPLIRK